MNIYKFPVFYEFYKFIVETRKYAQNLSVILEIRASINN